MIEYLDSTYLLEEEFLAELGDVAIVAAKLLNGDWEPNYSANDDTRRTQILSFISGKLDKLVFESARTYHNNNGISSAQITLKSSRRIVCVRVQPIKGKQAGELLFDNPPN